MIGEQPERRPNSIQMLDHKKRLTTETRIIVYGDLHSLVAVIGPPRSIKSVGKTSCMMHSSFQGTLQEFSGESNRITI